MRVAEAAGEMVRLLPTLEEEVSRAELVLALARIVGGERDFTRLWRKARRDAGTGLSQALIPCMTCSKGMRIWSSCGRCRRR